MSVELEKEFSQVISEVTKEVTDEVIKNSALKSVEKMNKNILSLQRASGSLVTDINKAQQMYCQVGQETEKSLRKFDKRIDTWAGKQDDLVQEMQKTNSFNKQALGDMKVYHAGEFKKINSTLDQIVHDQIQQSSKQKQNYNKVMQNLQDIESQLVTAKNLQERNQQNLSSTLKKITVFSVINFLILLGLAGYTVKSLLAGGW